eukprot:6752126-Ditylum_brightwellii.AAC.1
MPSCSSPSTLHNDGRWGAAGYTFVGDFNGDGKDDIASGNGGSIYLKLGPSCSSFDSKRVIIENHWGAAGYTFV